MKLVTQRQLMRLIDHGLENFLRRDAGKAEMDFWPLIKLFCPWSGATWLITELDPANIDRAFGLCDLGMGSPEIGSVSLTEIMAVRGPGGLKIERDIHFEADKTLRAYAEEARRLGRIKA